jgi:hypothetical protein
MNSLDISLIEKCRQVKQEMSQTQGDFTLFGLFEREETAGKWDILVSAPWLTTGLAGTQRIVDALLPVVSKAEWLRIAGIIALESSSSYVQWIAQRFSVEHGLQEVVNTFFDGVPINHAYVITASKTAAQMRESQMIGSGK